MSNNPGLDLDHHVPQHIFQSVGSIYNLEGCHIAGYTLKEWHPSRLSIHWTDFLLLVTVSGKPAQKTVTIGGYWRAHLESISCYVASFQIVYWANRLQNMLGNMESNQQARSYQWNMVVKFQIRVIWHGLGSGIGTEVIGCITGEQIWILESGIRLTR